jgi:hypothetical protein
MDRRTWTRAIEEVHFWISFAYRRATLCTQPDRENAGSALFRARESQGGDGRDPPEMLDHVIVFGECHLAGAYS